MENNKRRTADSGNTATRELFVDAESQELPTEKILDIEDDNDDHGESDPPGDE